MIGGPTVFIFISNYSFFLLSLFRHCFVGSEFSDDGRDQLSEEVELPMFGRNQSEYVSKRKGRFEAGRGDGASLQFYEHFTADEAEYSQEESLHPDLQDCPSNTNVGHPGVL